MSLKSWLLPHQKEEVALENIRRHIRLLCDGCESFRSAMETGDRSRMQAVVDLEREGDSVRRQIVSNIYAGAFMPYVRPYVVSFVEAVDSIFDLLEDTALDYQEIEVSGTMREECLRVALLNLRMCEMMAIAFEATISGEDLREKALAIRLYEKKIDDIKFGLMRDLRDTPVTDFWKGKSMSDFVTNLTTISDIVEDAVDYLQIISVSMR
jgi:predicted phosphate transport protein (TIGR00153 family)